MCRRETVRCQLGIGLPLDICRLGTQDIGYRRLADTGRSVEGNGLLGIDPVQRQGDIYRPGICLLDTGRDQDIDQGTGRAQSDTGRLGTGQAVMGNDRLRNTGRHPDNDRRQADNGPGRRLYYHLGDKTDLIND